MEKYQVGLDRKEELTDKNCTKAEEFSSCRNGVNRKEKKTGESCIKAEGLSRRYRNFRLHGISLEVPAGSIFGLLGRNGAGKTTVIKLLSGHTKKSGGKIWIAGYDMDREPIPARAQIGLMMDEPMFFETRSLWENGMAFGSFYPDFSKDSFQKWLSVFRLKKSAWPGMLSKGERLKFQFAFALSHHPKTLLLDEPTGNLDPVFRKEFLELLQEAVEEEQIGVLFSSHLTTDLEQIADGVALLEQGKLLYSDSIESLKSRYCLLKGAPETGNQLKLSREPGIVGIQVSRVGFEALADLENLSPNLRNIMENTVQEEVDLSKWMYYMIRH